jgi:recombination protein RecT
MMATKKNDTTEIAPTAAPRAPMSVASQVRDTLNSPAMMAQLKLALPRHMSPERMIRVAVTAIQKTPKLMECSQQSLIACIVEASQLGLEPDGVIGHAYLVPYKNKTTGRMEAQLMAGYKGLIELARRSGQIGAVNAEIVFANDEFRIVKGLNPDLIHIPNWEDPGEMIAAYATAKLKDGDVQFCVLSRAEIGDRVFRAIETILPKKARP